MAQSSNGKQTLERALLNKTSCACIQTLSTEQSRHMFAGLKTTSMGNALVRVIWRRILRRRPPWQRRYAEEWHAFYYWNPETGEAQWKIPLMWVDVPILQHWCHICQDYHDIDRHMNWVKPCEPQLHSLARLQRLRGNIVLNAFKTSLAWPTTHFTFLCLCNVWCGNMSVRCRASTKVVFVLFSSLYFIHHHVHDLD